METEAQWQSLCTVLGDPEWGFETHDHAARNLHHDGIDAVLSAWTRQRSAQQVMDALQQVMVPAGVVQRSSDLLRDPQYAHRNFYRYFDHPEMGHIPYAGHQYSISSYDNAPRGPAPCLGQHSFEVLSELLGMSDEDIAEAYASGVIT